MELLPLEPSKETIFVNQYPSANTNDGGFQFVFACVEQEPPQTAFTEGRISSGKLLDGVNAWRTRLLDRVVAFGCGFLVSVFTLIEGGIFTFDEGRDGERVRVHVGSM